MKDETALQFFSNIQIPPTWRFGKYADYPNSPGRVYEVNSGIWWRVFFFTITGRGGITECNIKNNSKKILIDNKNSEQINEYIQHGIQQGKSIEADN